jgi:hypothetical protein
MAGNHFDTRPGAFASHTTNHQRTTSSEPSATAGPKKTQLLVDFQPSDYSVICGRGKANYNHIGNRRFRIVASMFIERYSRAGNKAAKSAIVSEIIEVIREAGGNFCNFKSGAWFEVEDLFARGKVSAFLRDLLHTKYRSSAKAKRDRLKTLKQQQNQNQQSGQERVEGTGDSDDSSTTSSCWGMSKNSLGFEYWLEEPDDFFNIDVFSD